MFIITRAAKEVSANAAGVAVLSELGGIFTLKKEQITAQKAFVGGEDEIFHAGSGGS